MAGAPTRVHEIFPFNGEIGKIFGLTCGNDFLCELIINSCDALDRIRYESRADKSKLNSELELFIHVVADQANGTISVIDNGIGMTKYDLVNYLGTIEKSGMKEFMEALPDNSNVSKRAIIDEILRGGASGTKDSKALRCKETMSVDSDESKRARSGVGFYSTFAFADKVTVTTKHNDDHQYIWEFNNEDDAYIWLFTEDKLSYTMVSDEWGSQLSRGTVVTVLLKKDQIGYLEGSKLKGLVKEYSNLIAYPTYVSIIHNGEAKSIYQIPLWLQKPDEIAKDEYVSFYKSLHGDQNDPLVLKHITYDKEPWKFKAILFIPSPAHFDIFNETKRDNNIKLYAGCCLISQGSGQILPAYLDFMKGVIDSDDLPFNLSRIILSELRLILCVIRENLAKHCIEMLVEISQNEKKYCKLYGTLSPYLNSGILEDVENRAKLADLLRYETTTSAGVLTSLKDYVARMEEGQEGIYYILGPKSDADNSAFLARFIDTKGYEVLLLESMPYVLMALKEYDGKAMMPASMERPRASKMLRLG